MIEWTECRIAVDALKPYERNPRRISAEQYQKLLASIRDNGYHHRLIATKDLRIIGGHQRLRALKELGITEVAILTPDCDIPDEQFRRLLVQDNLPFGEFNFDMLRTDFTIDELKYWGMPADWLQKATPPHDDAKADETPALESKVISKPGDLWLLGSHRVLCGDSTKAEDVSRLFNESNAELLFTSPPYSDMRDYNGESDLSPQALAEFITAATPHCEFMAVNLGLKRSSDEIVPYWDIYLAAAKSCGLKLLSWNVWDKGVCGSIGNQTAMFGINHEWIFVFSEPTKKLNCTVENKTAGELNDHNSNRQKDGSIKKQKDRITASHKQLSTILSVTPQMARDDIDHPARFPMQLPREYILAMTNEGDAVYDPFLGSGTTMIAAEQTKRKFMGMEISPAYVDTIIRRWQTFTGEFAIMDGDGRSFVEIEKSRT